MEQIEILLIKTLLAENKPEQGKELGIKTTEIKNIAAVEKRPCASVDGQCNYRNQLLWQEILLGSKNVKKQVSMKDYSNLFGISDEMWYCMNTDDACPKKRLQESVVQFGRVDVMRCSSLKDRTIVERSARSGPSSEQLSRILLRLREEVSIKLNKSFYQAASTYTYCR